MAYVLQHLHVADYATFRSIFDDHSKRRRQSGSLGGRVFRIAGDPKEILILLEWDEVDRAQAFVGSRELREAAEWAAGGPGRIEQHVLEEIDEVPA
jgi:heme-degrading monooxygenase HmoA